MSEKRCAKCLNFLATEQFGRNSKTRDKLHFYCRDCLAAMQAETYQRSKSQRAEQRKAFKQQWVDALGGKCARCEYDEFLAGLDFHHLEAEDKEHGIADLLTWAMRGNPIYLEQLRSEISKCILLCRNCHQALHAGEWTLNGSSETHSVPLDEEAASEMMQQIFSSMDYRKVTEEILAELAVEFGEDS